MRPCSFGRLSWSSSGWGEEPAVQTNVKLVIDVPSLSVISREVTAVTLVLARSWTPRSKAVRAGLAEESAHI